MIYSAMKKEHHYRCSKRIVRRVKTEKERKRQNKKKWRTDNPKNYV
jgi:hypothetical protein